MYLRQLKANGRWAFFYGSKPFLPVQLHESLPHIFYDRAEAVAAAESRCLEVDETGDVFDADPDPLPAL